MKITVGKNVDDMACLAAELVAKKLQEVISEKGEARVLLSTGESQFAVIKHLADKELPWDRVTLFHLDEYIGLPETHKASFRKYLKERIVDIVHPKEMVYVNGEGDVVANIAELTAEIRKAPIDLALIGIGENAHIAFNDPRADFDTCEAYIVVTLDDACKKQQVGEGWFETIDDVPKTAISITVHQIMRSEVVISCVPGERKAVAIRDTLSAPAVTNQIPSTKLREHPRWYLFLDKESASLTDPQILEQ